MKIIVCGAGLVGRHIAQYLLGEGNDITIIDKDEALIRELTSLHDMRGVTGFASHPRVLDEAGARDADMIIAATHSDEVNMVICQIAHSIFGITDKIARLRSESYTAAIYSDMYRSDHLPVDVVISPEQAVAEAIARRLRKPSAFDSEEFLDGKAQLLGLRIDENCPIVSTTLRQLSELFSSFHGVIVGVRREGKLFIPRADDQLEYNDEAYLVSLTEEEERAFEIFGKPKERIGRIVIIGGGDIGFGIAQRLEKEAKIRVKLVERDREQAEFLSDKLAKSVTLHGSGLDPALLAEANIGEADAVIAVTDDEKTNLLAAARAHAMGAKHSLVIVNDQSLEDLAAPLSIDTVINPRAITVSSVLQHVRHGRINAVYVVGENEAEIIEAEVLGTCRVHGKLLRDIDWPEGIRLGAVKKGNDIIIPDGGLRLDEGDLVTIFALRGAVPEVERLFQVSLDYF